MYSRNYNGNTKEEKVPVQLFEDSFTTKAFESMNSAKKTYTSCERGQKELSEHVSDDLPVSRNDRKLSYDDLLIAGLIIMFLLDDKKSNDIVIPVLLAVLLLS